MGSVEMIRNSKEEWPDDAPIGTFDIDTEGGVQGYPGAIGHIIFVCPSGKRCTVLIGPTNIPKENKNRLSIWAFNGNVDKPTLTPSINCENKDNNGGCGWHGFITDGVIK